MFRFFDDSLSSKEGVVKHEIRQIRVLQCHCAHEGSLLFRTNPQRHPAIVFDYYSWHSMLSFRTYSNSTSKKKPCQLCVLIAYMKKDGSVSKIYHCGFRSVVYLS